MVKCGWWNGAVRVIALAICCGAGLGSGVPLCGADVETRVNFNSFRGGPIHAALAEVLLVQGSPEPETLALAEALAGRLRRELPYPLRIQVRPFEAAPALALELDERLVLQLTRGEAAAGAVSFALDTLGAFGSADTIYDGLVLPEVAIRLEAGVTAAGLESAVAVLADKIIPELRFGQDELAVCIPELSPDPDPAATAVPPPLALPGVAEFTLILRGRGVHFRSLDVYRFRLSPESDQLAAVTAGLAERGFTRVDRLGNGLFRFRSADSRDEVIARFGAEPNPTGAGSSGVKRDYGYLIGVHRVELERQSGTAWRDDFRRKDLRSFVLMSGLRVLEGEELTRSFDAFFARPELSAAGRLPVLRNVQGLRMELAESFDREYCRLADELTAGLTADPDPDETMRQLVELWQFGDTIGRAYLTERLGSYFHRLTMPSPAPDAVVAHRHDTLPVGDPDRHLLLLELVFADPAYRDSLVWFGRYPLPTGRFRTVGGSSSGHGSWSQQQEWDDGDVTEGRLMSWQTEGNRSADGSLLGPRCHLVGGAADFVKIEPRPGELLLHCRWLPERNGYELDWFFQPPAPEPEVD